MGGHGGLNILPQKRWHLYRDDNRQRVARDQSRDREDRQQKQSKRNRGIFHEKVVLLRRRAVSGATEGKSLDRGAEIDSASDGESNNLHKHFSSESGRIEGKRAQEKTGVTEQFITNKFQDCRENTQVFSAQRRVSAFCSTREEKHCNFFSELEEASQVAQDKHAAYLKEIGHTSVTISDFDFVGNKAKNAWYLGRELPSALLYDEETRGKSSISGATPALRAERGRRSLKKGVESKDEDSKPTGADGAFIQPYENCSGKKPDRQFSERKSQKRLLPLPLEKGASFSKLMSRKRNRSSSPHSGFSNCEEARARGRRNDSKEGPRKSLERMSTSDLLARLSELEDRKRKREEEKRTRKMLEKHVRRRAKAEARKVKKQIELAQAKRLRKARVERELEEKGRVASLCFSGIRRTR